VRRKGRWGREKEKGMETYLGNETINLVDIHANKAYKVVVVIWGTLDNDFILPFFLNEKYSIQKNETVKAITNKNGTKFFLP
jgi:hypothetical protein